jgi:hypothetical protein
VTIVTRPSEMLWETNIERIRATIPGIQLEVVNETDFLPSVPEKYARHVENCAESIRKQLGLKPTMPR